MVEHQPSKLRVAGSNPVSRSNSLVWIVRKYWIGINPSGAHVAQLVEHLHGKQAVSSSNLLVGSTKMLDAMEMTVVVELAWNLPWEEASDGTRKV